MKIFVIVWSLFLTDQAFAQSTCGDASAIRRLEASPAKLTRQLYYEIEDQKYQAIVALARNLRSSYFSEQWHVRNLEGFKSCLSPDSFMILEAEFKSEMWRHSLGQLIFLGGGFEKMARFLNASESQIFNIRGHLPTDQDPDKAAFDRGEGSIFMNLAKIHPSEWIIYFVHEISHSLDSILLNAVKDFGNPDNQTRFHELTQKRNAWSMEDHVFIRNWLTSGFQRGLPAEHRAWTVTFALYESAKKNGSIQSIPWIEKFLEGRSPSDTLSRFVFTKLDGNFGNPTNGVWKLPAISRAISELRNSFRSQADRLPLGPKLQEIYDSATKVNSYR